MITRYTFAKPSFDLKQLSDELTAAATPGFTGAIGGESGSVWVDVAAPLTSSQQSTLAGLVASHTPDPNAPALRLRAAADRILDDVASQLSLLFRAFGLAAVDEFNVLRRQVIGGATAVWNPASIASGSGLTSPNVTVAGAAFGDFVLVSAPYSLQGLTATASVVAANTVAVRLENQTGGAVDLVSGSWQVVVWRPETMAPRTGAQLRSAIKAHSDAGDADA